MRAHHLLPLLIVAFIGCRPPLSTPRPAQQQSASARDSLEPIKIQYEAFSVLYSPRLKQPLIVDYSLTAEQVKLSENTPSEKRHFAPDPDLALPQATLLDYRGSGYARGHMARRHDMKHSPLALHQSDYLTNICPQAPQLNNGLWHKIENLVRTIALHYDSVHVCCGPLFTDTLGGYIGQSRIPVPDYFFKALLIHTPQGIQTIAYLCPNKLEADSLSPRTPMQAACTIAEIERLTGHNLFPYLPPSTAKVVESSYDTRYWKK